MTTTSNQSAKTRSIPPLAVVAILGTAWLPAIILAAFLPRFVSVFDRISEKGELPTLARTMLPLGRLGPIPAVLIVAGCVAVLVGIFHVWSRAGLRHRWIVLSALSFAGFAAFSIGLIGLIQPVYSIGAQVR